MAGEEGAALVAVVAAVVVEGDLYVGLHEGSFSGEAEAEVLNGEATGEPLIFIVSMDGKI